MHKQDLYYDYGVHSILCLERARLRLKEFDEGKCESLFYAALDLRMGIEARIYEYIYVTLRSKNRPKKEIKEYSASKLLKILCSLDKNALEPAALMISVAGSKHGNVLQYTPVTQKLAQYYGKLGEMLHHKFFRMNEYWYCKKKLEEEHGEKSLTDFRHFLEEVAAELEKVNRGHLSAYPSFFKLIEKSKNEE